MTKKLVSLFLALAMALSLTAAFAESTAVTVTDMTGREIALDAPATKVVALTASDCEILAALGAEDTLVGRGEYCDYPESILEVPAVQSGADTNLEQIIALEPQVVIMAKMAQTEEQVAALEEAGIRVVVSDAQDIEGVYTAIRLIGALVGRNDEAEVMVADMQSAFADIAAKSENTGKTVYFEVTPLQWGPWTAGKGTFMDELATLCGLTNAFADVEGYVPVDEEQVLERDPDYIVNLFGLPYDDDWIMGREGWSDLKAVVNGNVLDDYYDCFEMIMFAGPSLKDAALSVFHFVNGVETGEE